jgi:hypothetical protein
MTTMSDRVPSRENLRRAHGHAEEPERNIES